VAEITFGRPFRDDDGGSRRFDHLRDDYVWHRDHYDRTVRVIDGNGWQFQFDGCLPFLIRKGTTFRIERGVYHRLIKGVDELHINIIEHK